MVRLPSGASARVANGAIELREASGALVVRYVDGSAEIHAPRGDVTLAAPNGRVVLRSAHGVTIDAGDDLRVEAREGSFRIGRAMLFASEVVTAVTTASHTVANYQLTAERIIERARDVFRDVRGLWQLRLGRARTVVEQTHSLHARRNVQVSQEETRIDGREILLG